MDHNALETNNTLLLMQILGDVQNRSYIELVKSVENKLKAGIQDGEIDEGEAPVTHHFAPNVYMRQMDAPAGSLVVSKMHRTEHFLVFLSGSLSIITDKGVEYVKAPCIHRTMPGTKRIAYFHEDSTCFTIHPTQLTDVDEIEEEIIVPEAEVDAFLESIGHTPKELEP